MPSTKPKKKVVTKQPAPVNDPNGQTGYDQNQRPADGLHRYGRRV